MPYPSPLALMDLQRRQPPTDFGALIGPAAKIGRVLDARIRQAKSVPDAPPFSHIFYGPSGSGKTLLAGIAALRLAGDRLAVEDVSGLDVTIDVVRAWESECRHGSLFGDWQVKIIQELDRMPPAAQDRMLQYMDKLPPRRAILATSNLQIDLLQNRFQSRAQTWKVLGPDETDIRDFIIARWDVDTYSASQIAFGCGGNLRQALLDTQSVLDLQLAA